MLKRYRLRKAAQEGTPEVGLIELLLRVRDGILEAGFYCALSQHTPRPFDYYDDTKAAGASSASAKSQTSPAGTTGPAPFTINTSAKSVR